MSERIVIVSGCRTAVGKFGGALKDLEATDLGGIVKPLSGLALSRKILKR